MWSSAVGGDAAVSRRFVVTDGPVLGVDAGGSGTRAVLVEGGAILERFEESPLNVLLHDDAVDRLAELITKSGARAAGLGLAGVRGAGEAERLRNRIAAAVGIPVVVADDTEVAFLGAFRGAPGIIVIAGTGSNAFGRDAQGRAARVGGHGFLLGDEGGAYWIANQAIRAALHSFDGTGPKSAALEAAVLAGFGMVDDGFDGVVRLVHSAPADRHLVARLAPAVMALEDPVALRILDRATAALVAMAQTLRARLGPDLPVAMHGGVFAHPRIRERFVAATQAVEPAEPPELGAVRLLGTAVTLRDSGWAGGPR
ncbi:MAG: ATPase [Acidothermus sp.]|nr:ATPase [Acidothermus sp.]